MKRVYQDVEFHNQKVHKNSENAKNNRHESQYYTSHELDAKDMRAILTQLFTKTLDMKKKQKETKTPNERHHYYEGVFKESANIDKPPAFDETEFIQQELLRLKSQTSEIKDSIRGETTE